MHRVIACNTAITENLNRFWNIEFSQLYAAGERSPSNLSQFYRFNVPESVAGELKTTSINPGKKERHDVPMKLTEFRISTKRSLEHYSKPGTLLETEVQ
jgi:hypothetical protein